MTEHPRSPGVLRILVALFFIFVFPIMMIVDTATGGDLEGGQVVFGIIISIAVGCWIASKYEPERVATRNARRRRRHQKYCRICQHEQLMGDHSHSHEHH